MKLKNKVAIVTGGSRGIGKTIVEFYAREGAEVFILARDLKEIVVAVKDIYATTGKKITGLVCDVADEQAVTRIIAGIGKQARRIDVLVNCAGIQAPIGLFKDTKTSEWEKNIKVNLLGTVYACKAALPFMIKKRRGSIINFSGGGASGSRPNFSAYAVAKTGVVKLTEILADELAPYHVRVNAISPGGVNTFMLQEVLKMGEKKAGASELKSAKERAKKGGVAPEVPAGLAVFLASDDSIGLSGRMISAPFDDWKKWNKTAIKKIMATDAFKLRRVNIKK